MNVLYIHSHDTGRYVQPYGHAIETPNIQRLAEEGVLFRQAFTTSPTCSPSRAVLLTGEPPHCNGMIGLAHRGFSINDYGHHIVRVFKNHGYDTALSGIQHIASHTEDKKAWEVIGYDEYLGDWGEADDRAVDYLNMRGDTKTPFFLSVGFFETHREFPEEHPADDPRYCLPPASLPDTLEMREDMVRFKASARILDRKIGKVLNALVKNGLREKTLVICTTDHGIAFPRMKCNLEDSGMGVMLIMRGPKDSAFTGGGVCDSMVTHMDLFPTLCDFLGFEFPSWLCGKSMLPLMNGEVEKLHDAIFAELNYHAAFEPARAVRTKRWKYIVRYDKRKSPVLPNCDASMSKTVWLDHGWQGMAPAGEALYDLIFDPNETRNLADAPEQTEILNEMRMRLKHEMEETGDPLLDDDIPQPATALLNDRNDLDPTNDGILPMGKR